MPELKHLYYEGRLVEMHLMTIEEKTEKGDFITRGILVNQHEEVDEKRPITDEEKKQQKETEKGKMLK